MKKLFFFLFGISICFFMAGCQTTAVSQRNVNELSTRIHVLENAVNKKDREIRYLQNEVTNLSDQISKKDEVLAKIARPKKPRKISTSKTDTLGIIRVAAKPEEIQAALKNAGYYQGNVDGKIGPNTINAIGNFQKDNGLTPDSIIGKRTWEKLRIYLNIN